MNSEYQTPPPHPDPPESHVLTINVYSTIHGECNLLIIMDKMAFILFYLCLEIIEK